jgi:catechol 2,3-dioxygenase-like lactoylglutathione lyase family enzyme
MPIFTHVVVGTNDMKKAKAFYNDVLGPLGLTCMVDRDDRSMWGKEAPEFMVATPINGKEACYANGGTIGFIAPDTQAVDRFYAAALAKGGVCEGPPGPRPALPGTYVGYVRDPDGNKICAVHHS